MHVRVKLPSGPLIHYLKFCRVIAEAVCPIDKDLEGIKCVLAKIYPPDVPTPNFGPGVPYPLDETDRQALAKVLPKLPPLRYPMSEKGASSFKEESASFMEAYVNLPKRPEWIPLLVNEETILGRKIEHNQVKDRHLEAIREERKAGRLVPVDINYVPLEAVQIGAYLTRKDAIAYLERHGLAYDERETAKSPEQDSLLSETGHPALDADPLALSNGTSVVGQPIYSPAKKAEIVERSKELQAAGEKDYRARVAKEYGVTPKSIYNWVKKDEEMKKKQSPLASLFRGSGKK